MAAFFPKDILDEIRSRTNIIGVISDYVTLKKVGRNYKGLCPFHNEKTPSFSVSEEKQVFHCFGCHKGGDIIAFFKEVNNLTFIEAVTQLASRCGVLLPDPSRDQEGNRVDRDALIRINERARAYFHSLLMERPEGRVGREYLKKRGIGPEVWSIFSVGYAPDRWDGLTSFFTTERISLDLGKTVGLVVPRKSGGFFDYFRGRIIFPIGDYGGRPIGFGGRSITPRPPKYLNSPDSAVYRKGHSVFGLSLARDAIAQEKRIFLVEGYFDLLSLYQSGIRSVVSPLGTALTQGHIQLLKRYCSNFYVLFDADEAGDKAAMRSLPLFLDEGLFPRVVIMPAGSDPDDVIKEKGSDYFLQQVAGAPFLIDYFIDKTVAKNDVSRPEGKSSVIEQVIPVLNRVEDLIVRDGYVRQLAERMGVREDHVRRFSAGASVFRRQEEPSGPEEDRREAFLLAMVIQRPELLPVFDKLGVVEDLNNPDYQALGKALIENTVNNQTFQILELLDHLSEKQRNLVSFLAVKEEHFGNIEDTFKDCIRQIKRGKIKKMKLHLTQQIKRAQELHNDAEISELSRKKSYLILQEKNLNSSNWNMEETVGN